MEDFLGTISKNSVNAFVKGYEAKTKYNGAGVGIDLAAAVDHVGPTGKIVTSDTNQMNLTETIAYHLYLAGARDGSAVTSTHLSAATPGIVRATSLWNLYNIGTKAGVTVRFRQSDTLSAVPEIKSVEAVIAEANTPVASDTAVAPVDVGEGKEETKVGKPKSADEAAPEAEKAYVAKTALAIEKMIFDKDDTRFAEEYLADSDLAFYSVIACAVHREQNEGHSWYTGKTRVNGTPTFKAVSVAGSRIDEFRTWMVSYGHDSVHHLSDESIRSLAAALCASDRSDAGAKVIDKDIEYNGENVKGKCIHEIFRLSEASIARYPIGEMGKSAMVLGLQDLHAMLSSMLTKVSVKNGSAVLEGISRAAAALGEKSVTKDQISKLKIALTGIIALAFGYVLEAGISNNPHKESARAVVSRFGTSAGTGKALAIAIAGAPTNVKALSASIAGAFADIAGAVNKAVSILGAGPEVHAKFDTGDIEIGREASEVNHERMMELVKSAK